MTSPSRTLPPGPAPVGNISIGRARNLYHYVRDPFAFVQRRFDRYGDTYLVRTGSEMLYAFRHPDDIKAVLVDQADAFRKAEFGLEKVLGEGLLTSEGSLWKQRRRTIQPAFSRRRIESYGAAMVQECERRVATWRSGVEFDAASEMMRITLSIVARTLFSHTITHEGREADSVGTAMAQFQESIGVFDVLPDWLPTPKHRRTQRAIAEMDAMMYGVIDERMRARASGSSKDEDLLDALLDARDPEGEASSTPGSKPPPLLDRTALRDELITLFMAGHETTANALSWAWYFLGRNPSVQGKLAEELAMQLDPAAPLSVEDLASLPYLKAVCEETLRHRPPAYVLARTATREVEIGDWRLPKDAAVVLWTYMTQHDARWWPTPQRFDPERFLGDGGSAARPKFAYLPFGGGARMCIGKHFALMEMQLLLGTMVRRVDLQLAQPGVIDVKPRITLAPAGGVPARVEPRTAQAAAPPN